MVRVQVRGNKGTWKVSLTSTVASMSPVRFVYSREDKARSDAEFFRGLKRLGRSDCAIFDAARNQGYKLEVSAAGTPMPVWRTA